MITEFQKDFANLCFSMSNLKLDNIYINAFGKIDFMMWTGIEHNMKKIKKLVANPAIVDALQVVVTAYQSGMTKDKAVGAFSTMKNGSFMVNFCLAFLSVDLSTCSELQPLKDMLSNFKNFDMPVQYMIPQIEEVVSVSKNKYNEYANKSEQKENVEPSLNQMPTRKFTIKKNKSLFFEYVSDKIKREFLQETQKNGMADLRQEISNGVLQNYTQAMSFFGESRIDDNTWGILNILTHDLNRLIREEGYEYMYSYVKNFIEQATDKNFYSMDKKVIIMVSCFLYSYSFQIM